MATFFSYACHPTGAGDINLIGGGYAGFAMDALEKMLPGSIACYLPGCGGDQKPFAPDPNDKGFRRLDLSEVKRLGHQLAASVNQARIHQTSHPVAGPIIVGNKTIQLKTQALDRDRCQQALTSENIFERSWAEYFQDTDNESRTKQLFPFEIQVIRFGSSCALITMSGEMSVEHALRIQKQHGFRFPVLFALGYANDIVGYVPVKRQIAHDGYEVWTSNQIFRRTGPFEQDTEDRIHQAVNHCLSHMEEPNKRRNK
jgi:hypothetical protein